MSVFNEPDHLTADEIAVRLLGWSLGVNDSHAAINLLFGHGHWFRQTGFVRECVKRHPDPFNPDFDLWFDWAHAAEMVETGRLKGSPSELAILRIALSLGGVIRISLSAQLGSLDRANIALVLAAIRAANGA